MANVALAPIGVSKRAGGLWRQRATGLCILLSVGLLGCDSAEAPSVDAGGKVLLEYVAHSCFRITSPDGHTVLIDPYESRWWLGYDFPAGLAATEAVLITHPHSDHDGGMAAHRDLPWKPDTQVLTDPGEHRLGDIRVIGIAGKHADPYGKEFGQKNTIWLLEIAGLRIVHVGDNGPVTDAIVEQAGRVDILMLPIDSDYHILAKEAVEAFRERLAPRVLIPMHYRHPDLETDPDSPDDLGGIDDWLKGQEGVRRLDTSTWQVNHAELPDSPQVWVFDHSPKVSAPSTP